MKEVGRFFSFPKRRQVLNSKLGCGSTNLCEHRWVDRHGGILLFAVNLSNSVECFDNISNWEDRTTAAKAASLASALCEPKFVVSKLSFSDILSLTMPLSKVLQNPSLDPKLASEIVEHTNNIPAIHHEQTEKYFPLVWRQAETLAQKLNIQL